MMSLPVPLSPEIRTGISAPATRSSFWRTSCMTRGLPKDDGLGGGIDALQSHSRCWCPPAKSPGVPFLRIWNSYQEIAFLAPTRVRVVSSCNVDCKPLNLSTLLYHRLSPVASQKSKIQTLTFPINENCFIFGVAIGQRPPLLPWLLLRLRRAEEF